MALTLTAEYALERTLGGLTEEDFVSVRITHSFPDKKGPHVSAQDIIQVVTNSTQQNASYHWKQIK